MNYPDYLVYYHHLNSPLFQNIMEHGYETAKAFLKDDHPIRGKKEYLDNRIKIEGHILRQFKKKGGIPTRKHPVYMSLGKSAYLERHIGEYFDTYRFPISLFRPTQVSFTYSDSMFSIHEMKPSVYLLDELEMMVKTHGLQSPEAQVWDDGPITEFLNKGKYE